MTEYLNWNDALARRYFNEEVAGKAVFLSVSGDVIESVARELGDTPEGFIRAVKTGPSWVTRPGICQKALQAFTGWRSKNLDYPPYLAYLALFVRAVGSEGEYASHSYYPRLRDLLGEPGDGGLPSFGKMLELWDDLEKWSILDRDGEWGLFEARISGSWIKVGLPTSQKLLTVEERRELPGIFADSHLDPLFPPPIPELVEVCRRFGAKRLRPKTLQLLKAKVDDAGRIMLLDLIAEELASWDGIFFGPGSAEREKKVRGYLHLNLDVNPVAGNVKAFLRCRLSSEFPEDGLEFQESEGLGPLWCEECIPGWSTMARVLGSGVFDASQFDWSKTLGLIDADGEHGFRRAGRNLIPLVEGRAFGLPGLIEVFHQGNCDKAPPFLLFHNAVQSQVHEWAKLSAPEFQELKILSGLPRGWLLASTGQGSSPLPASLLPLPSSGRRPRLRLEGLRRSRGRTYFSFARPSVYLLDGDPGDHVLCNGNELTFPLDSGRVLLPEYLPEDEAILLEVRRDGETLHRQSFYLTSMFQWRTPSVFMAASEWGRSTDTPVIGAQCNSAKSREQAHRLALMDDDGQFLWGGATFYLIGREVGEVSVRPDEPIPEEWSPVWCIRIGKKGSFIRFVGVSIEGALPKCPSGSLPPSAKLWKKILWNMRKRVSAPEHPGLKALWREYQEVASRV